jgi:hypothetical protein
MGSVEAQHEANAKIEASALAEAGKGGQTLKQKPTSVRLEGLSIFFSCSVSGFPPFTASLELFHAK